MAEDAKRQLEESRAQLIAARAESRKAHAAQLASMGEAQVLLRENRESADRALRVASTRAAVCELKLGK